MWTHFLRVVSVSCVCVTLLSGAGITVSAQPTGTASDIPSANAVGPDAGYRWYQGKADEWGREASGLRMLQVLFAGTALIGAVLGAAGVKVPRLPDRAVAIVTAIAIALFAGFDLNSQANKQRAAWRHLTAALAEYRDGGGKIEAVRKAYNEAEDLIGDFTPATSSE